MRKTVLVTGGGGFIGHHLVNHLIKDNRVVVLDNFSRGTPERLAHLENDIVIKKCDITSYEDIESCLNGIDIDTIFHLAAINGTGNFYKIPIEIMDVGVIGCFNILRYAKEFNVSRIITASSAEVYQEPSKIPTPEDIPLIVPEVKNPRFSYGLSKIYTEYYSYHFGLKHNMNISIFRPHNVFGPDMGLQHVIPQFIMEFLKENSSGSDIKIKTKGSLEAVRAFCYVDDIVKGLDVIHKKNNGVNVYNIGNVQRVSMKELLLEIGNIFDCNFKIQSDADEHLGGSMLRCPDISKIESLGFECSTSLEVGLKLTIAWYKENFHKLELIKNSTY